MAGSRSFTIPSFFVLRVKGEVIRLVNLITTTCIRPFFLSITWGHDIILTRIMIWGDWSIFNANAIRNEIIGAPSLLALELVFGYSCQLLVVAYRTTSAVLSCLLFLVLKFVKELGIEVNLPERAGAQKHDEYVFPFGQRRA